MTKQGDVKVQTAGVIQEVSSGISESEAARRHESRWVPEQWTETLRVISRTDCSAAKIRIRCDRPDSTEHASVIGKADTGVTSLIDDAERRSRLKECNARYLPPIKKSFR